MSVYLITCDIFIKDKFCNKLVMQSAYKDKVKCIEVAKELIKQDIDGFKQVEKTETNKIQYIYEIVELPVYE